MTAVMNFSNPRADLMVPFPVDTPAPRRAQAVCEFQGYVDHDTAQAVAGWRKQGGQIDIPESAEQFYSSGGFGSFNWDRGFQRAKETAWEWNATAAVTNALLRGGGFVGKEQDSACEPCTSESKTEQKNNENVVKRCDVEEEDWVVVSNDLSSDQGTEQSTCIVC
eukprot:g6076.t1